MTISVPDRAKQRIQKEMAKAGFKDPGKYFLSLVDRERHRVLRKEVEKLLAEALKEQPVPLTEELMDEVRRDGKRMIAEAKSSERKRRH